MPQEIKTYEVSIAGVPLKLKASHDQETVNEILKMVENQMDENLTNTSLQSSAILACLRLAEELYLLRKKAREELDSIETMALDHLSHMQAPQ